MPHLDITTVSAVRYSAVQCTPERCAARFRWALHRTPGPQTASPSPKRVRTAEQAPRSADFQSVTVARKSVPRPVTPARSGFEPQNRRTEETAESPKVRPVRAPGLQLAGVSQLVGRVPSRGESTKETTMPHLDITTVSAVRYSAVQCTPERCAARFRWALHRTPGPQTASPSPKRVRTAEQAPRSADFQSVTVARKSVPRPVTPARSGSEPQNR